MTNDTEQHRSLKNQRGIVTVEMLVLAPLLIVITALVIYAADMGVTDMKNRKDVRNCVWQYAVNGCKGTPTCTIDGLTPANQNRIRQDIDTELDTLATHFQHNRGVLNENVHGRAVSASQSVTTTEHSTGIDHTHNAFLTTLCDTETNPREDWDKYRQDTLDDHCRNNAFSSPYCMPR